MSETPTVPTWYLGVAIVMAALLITIFVEMNLRAGWDKGITVACQSLGYLHGARDESWHPVCWNDGTRIPLHLAASK